jgi:hypothetical protein
LLRCRFSCKKLAPIMGEDSDLAAGILIMALRREFGF